MTVSVQSVVDRVQATLVDKTGVRWPINNELVLWVNDAQKEIALLKPDAAAESVTITLVTGTKQSIPAAGNRLLGVVRNMSAASSGTGKRAIRLVQHDALNSQTPDWHDPSATGSAAHGVNVKHYVYDEQNPREFYVYPGVAGNAYIEIIHAINPTTVSITDNLSIPDLYSTAVMNYVLYMCYMKDAEVVVNAQRAGTHYQLFTASVMGKTSVDLVTDPNADRSTPAPVAAAMG